MATATDGDATTRLAGRGPSGSTVRVTLARCSDAKGSIVDRVRVHPDSRGRLQASRGRAGLCAVELEQIDG